MNWLAKFWAARESGVICNLQIRHSLALNDIAVNSQTTVKDWLKTIFLLFSVIVLCCDFRDISHSIYVMYITTFWLCLWLRTYLCISVQCSWLFSKLCLIKILYRNVPTVSFFCWKRFQNPPISQVWKLLYLWFFLFSAKSFVTSKQMIQRISTQCADFEKIL